MSEPRRKNRFQFSDLRDAGRQMRRLAPYMLPYKGRFGIYLLATVVYWLGFAGRAAVIGPFVELFSHFTDKGRAAEASAPEPQPPTLQDINLGWLPDWVEPLYVIPILLLIAGVAMSVGTLAKQYQMHWLMFRATVDVQRKLMVNLMHQPISFFNTNRKGELMSRVTNDLNGVRATFHIVFNDLISHPIGVVVIMAGAIWTSPQLALLTLVVPVVMIPVFLFTGKIKRLAKVSYEKAAELTNFFHQYFEGVRVVKAFGMEKAQEKELDRAALEWFRRSVKVGKYMGISRAAVEIVLGVVTAAAVFLGLWLVQKPILGETLSFGTTAQFGAFLIILYDPLRKLGHTFNAMSEAMAANERVFDLMDRKPALSDAPGAVTAPKLTREIVFDDVSFEYLPGRPILRNVSFMAKAGTMTALVGPTGAGKSTLLDLIPRFYAPTGGRVLVDGVDLATVTSASWLQQIAVVSQETFLFNTSVRENLMAANPGATEQDLIEALKAANVWEEISSLPNGLDTPLGDRGVSLSGGQRQRLAIARAFVTKAPVLLLDEATSALDTETERRVQEALDRLIRGATVFAIAHRLSTVAHAHQILVIENGEITERGDHASLMAAQGRYAMLYRTQLAAPSESAGGGEL